MIIIYLGCFLILVTLLSQGKLKPEFGFLIIFVIMAFQSNVEGDFAEYKAAFENNVISRTVEDEPLWQFLNDLFKPFGFLTFNIFLCAFQLFVLLSFCNKYSSSKYLYLAPILFLFTNSMMLIHMKAIRQCLAIELCVLPFLVDYAKCKQSKWLYVLIPFLLAFLIHNSAVVAAVPLALYYLQGKSKILSYQSNNTKSEFFFPILVTGLFFVLYVAKESILYSYFIQLGSIMQAYDIRGSGYASLEENGVVFFDVSWLIILYDAIMVFFTTWYFRRTCGVQRVFAICSLIASFWDMMFFGMGSLMRVGYYYSIFNLVLIPNLAEHIENRFGSLAVKLFIVTCVGYAIKTTWPSFTSSAPELFGNYKFIFWN